MNREHAWNLVNEYTKNQNLVKHMLCVEAAMRFYAKKYGEDEEKWAVTGLVHDFDYEKYPNDQRSPTEEHPAFGVGILREQGYPDDVCQAVLAHGDYTGEPRESLLAKALYACDELTGLVVAVALVRPSKKLSEVDVKAVKKKWKDKGFARGVHREDIVQGAEDLGVPLEEHIENVITAMQGISEELGL